MINVNGVLKLSSTWNINITSLASTGLQGAMPTFNNTGSYAWPAITTSGGITGFNAANVTLNTGEFANALGGNSFGVALDASGDNLYVTFNVTGPLAAPSVACPNNIVDTTASYSCGQTESFAATVTAGNPAPYTLTYNLNSPTGPAITSPYFFPVGTSTVYVTAANGVLPAGICSFTVTINDPITAPSGIPFGVQAATTTTVPLGRYFEMCGSSNATPFTLTSVTNVVAGNTVTLTNGGTGLTYTAAPGAGTNLDTVSFVLSDGCTSTDGTFQVVVTPAAGGNLCARPRCRRAT